MRLLLTGLLSLAILVAGCGQAADSAGDFEGAEADVARAVEELQEAAVDDEEQRICRQLLTAELARAAGDCNAVVQQALDEADATELDVQDVAISGSGEGATARARVETGTREAQTETFELVFENRSWRISSLGG